MLKRLRRKFIFINMTFVGCVLLCVFAAVCFTSYRSLYSDVQRSLQMAVDSPDGAERPLMGQKPGSPEGKKGEPSANFVAVFNVLVDNDGNITKTDSHGAAMSADDLERAVQSALETGEKNGLIRDQSLYFLRGQTDAGTKIAFADASYLSSSMRALVGTSLLIGLCGMVAFWFISLFLSKWALRPVENAWKQQRQFVADASHELKTPLTVILANNNILQEHLNDTIRSQRKWVDSTGEEAEHMRKLVDALLFLAKTDSIQEARLFDSVDFSELAVNTLLQLEPVAFEKGVELVTEVTPGITISGDATQLKQLLHILLDNACKYAGRGGKVQFTLQRQPNGQTLLKVFNTGEKIASEEIPHIFERFYRADKARAHTGGFGLGLAIAKSIVQLHRGTITAVSNDEGTTFTVLF